MEGAVEDISLEDEIWKVRKVARCLVVLGDDGLLSMAKRDQKPCDDKLEEMMRPGAEGDLTHREFEGRAGSRQC